MCLPQPEPEITKPTKTKVRGTLFFFQLNESSAATTVFSFVDRERSAQENTENPTEAALAQLYAYIQSLPESSKKRRLVKQFNKENGNGTPNNNRTRSFGDSIKVRLQMIKFIGVRKSGVKLHSTISSLCATFGSPNV